MVIENPWSEQHYLVRYWPLKRDIIDRNRHERGDYYKKPTQYWFIGFKPYHNTYMFHENYGDLLTINSTRNAVKRSMIHPDCARRFILEHVIPQRDELMM